MSHMLAIFRCNHTSIRTHVQISQVSDWLHSHAHSMYSASIFGMLLIPIETAQERKCKYEFLDLKSFIWCAIVGNSVQLCQSSPKAGHYLTQAQMCRVSCFYLCRIVPCNRVPRQFCCTTWVSNVPSWKYTTAISVRTGVHLCIRSNTIANDLLPISGIQRSWKIFIYMTALCWSLMKSVAWKLHSSVINHFHTPQCLWATVSGEVVEEEGKDEMQKMSCMFSVLWCIFVPRAGIVVLWLLRTFSSIVLFTQFLVFHCIALYK